MKTGFDYNNQIIVYIGGKELLETYYLNNILEGNYLIEKAVVQPINGIGAWTLRSVSYEDSS